jgi:hypothetical protein
MSNPKSLETTFALDALTVKGYKSIVDEQSIEIRPLTVLSGANSSGKTSMLQPLLLLKQTLEAQYDPGPMLLNGPNVKLTSVDQIIPILKSDHRRKSHLFSVGLRLNDATSLAVGLRMGGKAKGINIDYMDRMTQHINARFEPGQLTKTRLEVGQVERRPIGSKVSSASEGANKRYEILLESVRNRCFIDQRIVSYGDRALEDGLTIPEPSDYPSISPWRLFGDRIQEVLHVAGLRGWPERSYPTTAIGPRFPGTFEPYVASLVAHWNKTGNEKLQQLNDDLNNLGLTWKVEAKAINDTQIEILVGRLRKPKRGGAKDLVNIADVGFGVSQTLPVVVALRAAEPGQLVYIEQPEIHLHPRAQVAMAGVLAKAAARGVRVVVETHSSLLILAIQTLVAQGSLDSKSVRLNWFLRDDLGSTHIYAADLDEAGRFGDWPEDFADVALETEDRYLSAAERRLIEVGQGG